MIETLPDADGEAIELPPVHALHTEAPRGHNDGRRW